MKAILQGQKVSGLPEGGTVGQVLTKTETSAEWNNVPSDLPAGGTDGQILTKTSDGVAWEDAPEGGVISFNGRQGEVTPQNNDYTAEMVGARPSTWTPTATEVGAIANPAGGVAGQILEKTASGTQWVDKFIQITKLQTICENIELTDQSPSYAFLEPITLDQDGLYFLDYRYYNQDGSYSGFNSHSGYTKVDDVGGYLRWLTNNESNSITVTSTQISDTWRETGVKSVISIYKVLIQKNDSLTISAINFDGYDSINPGSNSHAEGRDTVAYGMAAHAEGRLTTASGDRSHAQGLETTASGRNSHAEGEATTASGGASHAQGRETTASGQTSHAEGDVTTASGQTSHAEGYRTTASGNVSHAGGWGTIAAAYGQTAIGANNVEYAPSKGPNYTNTNAWFLIGCGSSSARQNAFRVGSTAVYGGTYNSSGADYAEYFEWLDSNAKGEDRAGRFVTLDGEKIRLATAEDEFILGIVSAAPSVIGDAHEDQWQGMNERDIFGRYIWEEVEVPAEIGPEGEITSEAHMETRQKLSPNYDNTQKYIPRSKRTEWDAIGMIGKLVVVDDGTCEVNRYCAPGTDGIATKANGKTRYRVMARLDNRHIKVLIF